MATVLPTDVVSACVVASAVDTPYRAAGRGLPIVVLSAAPELQTACLLQFPRHIRVLAPSLNGLESHCDTSAKFSSWLINFLDALGIDQVSLATDTSFAGRAVEFALRHSVRVRQLAVLQTEHPEQGGHTVDAKVSSAARLHIVHWPPAGEGFLSSTSRMIADLTSILEQQKASGS